MIPPQSILTYSLHSVPPVPACVDSRYLDPEPLVLPQMAEETNGLRFRAGPGHVVTTAQQIPMSITATEATFDIESVEIKTCHTPKPIPGSLWAVFLKIFNLTNVVAYLVCLFANILAAHRQGQTGLLVPLLFAVSQIFEHCKSINHTTALC